MRINLDPYVDRLFDKDEEAFRVVYDETKKGVYSIIIGIINHPADVEDLMQDTYIRMLKSLHTYQKGRNFPAWIMQIAKNIALDHVRKYRKETIHDPQEDMQLFETPSSDQLHPELPFMELIQPLEPGEKQVVLLHIVQKMKFREIADLLEKPLGTILWIYNRAIKKLKNYLEKEET